LSRGRLLIRVWDRRARYPLVIDPLIQPSVKLVGDCTGSCSGPNGAGELSIGMNGGGQFGISVAMSSDGGTALVGAWGDNRLQGAAWVFTRSGSVWSQQGPKLVGDCTGSCSGPAGTGESGQGGFGESLALSSDGNTALIGAEVDTNSAGAAWVFIRSGSVWSQQGAKLVGDCTSLCSGPNGTGETAGGARGGADFGISVALSADGNTALIGGRADGSEEQGAAWVFTRSDSSWSQQGAKLVGDCTGSCSGPNGTGEIDADGLGGAGFGSSVALAADGNTALIGAPRDGSSNPGAAWVFTRSGSLWSQQGAKLVGECTGSCSGPNGTGEISLSANGGGAFGESVALSGTGDTALIGAPGDDGAAGAVWVFTRAGQAWSQQGRKLIADCTESCSGPSGIGEAGTGAFGISAALSRDGSTAVIGAWSDRNVTGAAWVFTRTGGVWSQQGAKLVADGTHSCPPDATSGDGCNGFGSSVALTSTGATLLIGAPGEDAEQGAAWGLTHQPPSNRFTVLHVHARQDGTITFAVTVPGPGTVDVLATAWKDNLAIIATLPQPALRRFTFARAQATARHAGTVVVSVTPNARGRRLVLHHTYRVTLRLWITYTPPGAPPHTIGVYGLDLAAAS
jgi:FG-GAP repeat